MFEQLGLIGCGLMGGSFALALKRAGLVKRVVGYSKSPSTTERARQMGVIDVEAPSALLAAAGADLVLLAVPVAATEATLKSIKHLVTPQMMIMDVGSTKVDVVQAARSALRDQIGSFVPAHPIAGKEVAGVEHADAKLYHGAQVILTPTERTLIAMPIWHSSPLNNWFLGTLLMGGTAVLMREYAPREFLETLAQERISFTFGAPIAFLAPLSVVPDVASYDFSAMRLWAYGGGPLGADMARKLAQAYRSDRFMQVYGMTESGPLGTVLYPEEAVAKAGSIGRCAIPGVELEVRRQDGGLCGPGEVGEICLRSAAMMQGYLDSPEATAAVLDEQGWYLSGDLARVDEDGYLYIVDRLKDMIVTGGENVYSKEVEDVLCTHHDVQDVAVIGRPHPEWGETVVAVLTLKPGKTPDHEDLRQFMETRLARYKIPRIFEVRDTLPRTATGKLLKHMLRGSASSH